MIHLACPLRQSFPESGNLFLSLEFTFYWLDWKSTSPRNSHVSAFHRTGVGYGCIELGLRMQRTGVTDAQNWGFRCKQLGLQMHRTGVSDAQNWGYGCTELGFQMHIQLVQMLRSELGCSWFQSKHFNCWASLQPAVSVFKLVFHCVSTIVLNWTV